MYTKYLLQKDGFVILNKWPGAWLFVFVVVMGFFVFAVASLFFVAELGAQKPETRTLLFSFLASGVGLLFVWTGFRSPARGYRESCRFDKTQGIVEIEVAKQAKRNIRLPLSDVHGFHIVEHFTASADSVRSTRARQYDLYLVLKDGSALWIAVSQNTEAKIRALLGELQQYLKDPLPELSKDSFLEISGKPFRDNRTENKVSLDLRGAYPSEFFQTELTSQGQLLRLRRKKRTWIEGFMLALIFLVFLAAPAVPALVLLDASGVGAIIFGLFLFFFCVIWYSIIFLVVIFQLRSLSVLASPDGLVLQLRFYLLHFLDRDIELPASQCMGMRLERLREGHWLLVILLKEPLQSRLGFLLSRSVGPDKPALAYYQGSGEFLLPVAYVEGWNRPHQGPLLEDLLSFQKRLAASLGL